MKQTESSAMLPSAPCASTTAPLPLMINARSILLKVTAQLLFAVLNNELEPSKTTSILNKVIYRCLNRLKIMYVPFTF